MEPTLSPPLKHRTPLGDVVTSQIEVDETGRFYREHIQLETTLTLVREPKATRDTGRNWET